MSSPLTSPAQARSSGSPLLVREKDLPAILNLSRATIRRAMEAGRFPRCVRIGRCIAWRRADLEKWIAAGCPACPEGDADAR